MTFDSDLRCGWCSFQCQTIFDLHIHLCGHTQTGCYIYDSTTCTGYPRFNPISCATQTDKDELFCCQDGFTQTDEELYWSTDSWAYTSSDVKQEVKSNKLGDAHKHKLNEENQNNSVELSSGSRAHSKRKIKSKKTFISSHPELKTNNTFNIKEEVIESPENTFNVIKVEPEAEKDLGHPTDDIADKGDDNFTPDFNIDEDTDDDYELPKPKKLKNKTNKTKPKTHRTTNIDEYQCKFCEETLQTKIKLSKHIFAKHPGEKAYVCQFCDKSFINRPERDRHRRKEHRKEGNYKVFQCDICSKTLGSSLALKSHLDMHKGVKDFECTTCNSKFRTASGLNQHVKRQHEISYDFMCAKCGKLFKTNDDLSKHKICCSGIRKFKCEVCEKSFFTNRQLVKHTRMHTGERQFVCDECGNTFRHKETLNAHKIIHTGKRPYACHLCPQTFAWQQPYANHMKIHNQDLRYVCPYCNKSFVKKCNMDVHILQHTGETPFKCDRCGQGFKQRVLLKRHMVQQHKNDLSREEIVKCTSTTTIKLGLQSADDMTRNEPPASAMQLGLPENPGWLQPFPTFQ